MVVHTEQNMPCLFFQSLPFGGVKDSGFGRFAGVEGLRACCLVKSVVEDRWWPFIKTKIPKPIQVIFEKFDNDLSLSLSNPPPPPPPKHTHTHEYIV